MTKWLSVEEYAKKHKKTRSGIYYLLYRGLIPKSKVRKKEIKRVRIEILDSE